MFKSLWKSKERSVQPIETEPPKQRDWLDDVSDEERDRVIEKIAQEVVKRGMDTPAVLFLEMHKPVSFFASQTLVAMSPFTAPFVGMGNVQVASKLMEKRENVELLIRRIEELAAEQDAEARAEKLQRRKEKAATPAMATQSGSKES